MCQLLEMSQCNVSQHLGVLRDRGLVDAGRDGNRAIYMLRDRRVANAINALPQVTSDALDRHRALRAGSDVPR
jgi:DNA-binding transcriptional ArsR family regulator